MVVFVGRSELVTSDTYYLFHWGSHVGGRKLAPTYKRLQH